jgi:hypothetical protein
MIETAENLAKQYDIPRRTGRLRPAEPPAGRGGSESGKSRGNRAAMIPQRCGDRNLSLSMRTTQRYVAGSPGQTAPDHRWTALSPQTPSSQNDAAAACLVRQEISSLNSACNPAF